MGTSLMMMVPLGLSVTMPVKGGSPVGYLCASCASCSCLNNICIDSNLCLACLPKRYTNYDYAVLVNSNSDCKFLNGEEWYRVTLIS